MWKRAGGLGLFFLLLLAGGSDALARPRSVTVVPQPRNITCKQFLRLGSAAATKILDFANGYAAGQLNPGTKAAAAKTPASQSTDSSFSLSNLEYLTIDQLRAICQVELPQRVLSVMPGRAPGGTSAVTAANATTTAGGTTQPASTGSVTPATTPPVTTSNPVATTPTTTTTPGSVSTDPNTGLAHVTSGTTTMNPPGVMNGGTTPSPTTTSGSTTTTP